MFLVVDAVVVAKSRIMTEIIQNVLFAMVWDFHMMSVLLVTEQVKLNAKNVRATAISNVRTAMERVLLKKK